ncbi:GNAT family N-acetyltransferase [Aspergillus tanneri]|uniref:N-acetyltransferase domain-containing protein n=1 Tax=Aspergillus tanneri TaxID=1220188 RepID=A0A5M9MJM4_9EURO|nr:uncharacterized protein ATNIH1004_009380 [Aspergillus tanneri]KAA8645163.1 hypothetical protein ATNIH1004_009380 [Aspergillus tanneri]
MYFHYTLGAHFSPILQYSHPTLHISYLQTGNPTHSTFLHHIWNTDDFIQRKATPASTRPRRPLSYRNPDAGVLGALSGGIASREQDDQHCLTDERRAAQCIHQPAVGYTSGQGYATEATIGLIDYARRQLGVEGVLGFCSRRDMRSRRVLEKIGLEFRGERKLKLFGGAQNAVYALPGMHPDLTVYGMDD